MKVLHVFTLARTSYFFDGQFRYLGEQGYDVLMAATYEPGIEEFTERNGVRYFPVDIPRSISPLDLLKSIFAIINIIKSEKPNAVFGHTPVGALAAMIASKLTGVRNRIYYRHGILYSTMDGVKKKIFIAEEKFVSSLATSIVTVSPSLAEKCVKDGINPADKQYVIGKGTCGGIDARNIFNPDLLSAERLEHERKRLGLKDSDIVFGFCGRLCKDKGIVELVDAFELFKIHHADLNSQLLLVGPFDERDFLSDKTLRKMQDDTDIIVTGVIDVKELPYFYKMMNCFVFPSHREGFGMCAIEASAMELPVLVSRSHGCIDSIVEEETGEYIDLTPESICAGMERMLDKDLRHYLGVNGRKFVLENYDFSVMWPTVAELYKKILKGKCYTN